MKYESLRVTEPVIPTERDLPPQPWWLLGDVVTLRHGTSEGHLKEILKNGLKPVGRSVEDMTKNILKSYLPVEEITDDFTAQVIQKTWTRDMRINESERGAHLFLVPYGHPDYKDEIYAHFNYEDGGEYARNVRETLETILGKKITPRFVNSRPVTIEVDVPYSMLGKDYIKDIAHLIAYILPQTKSSEEFANEARESTIALGVIEVDTTIPPDMIKRVVYADKSPTSGWWEFPQERLSFATEVKAVFETLQRTYGAPTPEEPQRNTLGVPAQEVLTL